MLTHQHILDVGRLRDTEVLCVFARAVTLDSCMLTHQCNLMHVCGMCDISTMHVRTSLDNDALSNALAAVHNALLAHNDMNATHQRDVLCRQSAIRIHDSVVNGDGDRWM